MLSLLKTTVQSLRTRGLVKTFNHVLSFIIDRYYERRFGMLSTQVIYPAALGFDNPDFNEYAATDFKSFRNCMNKIDIGKEDVFLDYGSGMGRVLIMAAMYPFQKVIGVELSPKLNAIATQNIERAKRFLKCKEIDVVLSDAAAYPLPRDVTVIYTYNSFTGKTLSEVLENIRESISRYPRPLTIVYKNPPCFEEQASKMNWLMKCFEYNPPYGHRYVVYKVINTQ